MLVGTLLVWPHPTQEIQRLMSTISVLYSDHILLTWSLDQIFFTCFKSFSLGPESGPDLFGPWTRSFSLVSNLFTFNRSFSLGPNLFHSDQIFFTGTESFSLGPNIFQWDRIFFTRPRAELREMHVIACLQIVSGDTPHSVN